MLASSARPAASPPLGATLLRAALARLAEEERAEGTLRAHLYLYATVRWANAATGDEAEAIVGFVDVAGVGKPVPGQPTGEDPVAKAVLRIVDTLAGGGAYAPRDPMWRVFRLGPEVARRARAVQGGQRTHPRR